MSTYLRDIPNNYVGGQTLVPATRVADANGTGIDMLQGDGRCTAILGVGAAAADADTLDVKIQESVDNSVWTDIAGATFNQVLGTEDNDFQTISFDRAARYLRAVGDVNASGTQSFAYYVILLEQKKMV